MEVPVTDDGTGIIVCGETEYLLNDQCGNNTVTVLDKKVQHSTDGTIIDYYLASIKTASFYSTYGAISKSFNIDGIDVAHNGQKRSTEISESAQTAQFWEYDADVARRWNVDPKPATSLSPYCVFNDNPILHIDLLGDTSINGEKYEGTNEKSATTLMPVVVTGKVKPKTSSIKEYQTNKEKEEMKIIINNILKLSVQRSPGFDWAGGGAFNLPNNIGSGRNVMEKPLSNAGFLVETGQRLSEETGTIKVMNQFKVLGRFINIAVIANHLVNYDPNALAIDGIEIVAARLAGPYYYATKALQIVVYCDFSQREAYLGLKAEFDNSRKLANYYREKGDLGDWRWHRDHANYLYTTLEEMEKSWKSSHLSNEKIDENE